MIPASIPADLTAFQTAVQAASPISALTPLQLRSLVRLGAALDASIAAAAAATGAILDGPDPAGHPTAMIAAFRARREAAADAATLADLRGLIGRAVLNLQAGIA